MGGVGDRQTDELTCRLTEEEEEEEGQEERGRGNEEGTGTNPTSQEQSLVQKERVGSLMHAVTGMALASQRSRVASLCMRIRGCGF